MKVLVIGQGGREHALVHALSHSRSVTEVHALPGNDGMKSQAVRHNINWTEREALIALCLRLEIDVVVVGPEDPLVAGLADSLRERGILVVGPSKEGARLEGSKVYAKQFMNEAGVPTADWALVSNVAETVEAAKKFTPPYVLKADGLAAGKGVFICANLSELQMSAEALFEHKILGEAGEVAALEQFTPGWEMSYLILTNGTEFEALPVAQDHKRLLDKDKGPNTGGMGTVAPLSVAPELRAQIHVQIVEPTLRLIREKGIVFRGVIFFGLMITEKGPSLLEYNCRFGDPETQVILPLVDGDWGEIFKSLSMGKLLPLKTRNLSAACVVMAAPGYPTHVEKGVRLKGDPTASSSTGYFVHAGTKQMPSGEWVTNGGRVLGAVGLGTGIRDAIRAAYEQSEKVTWEGMLKRTDIGAGLPV